MQGEKLCFRAGVTALIFAVILRLCSNGAMGAVVEKLSAPEVLRVLFFLESGLVMRPTTQTAPTETVPKETQPVQVQVPAQVQPVFGEADAVLVDVNNYSGKKANVVELLQKPLNWQLKQAQPTVLILHSHGTESYTKNEDYKETTKYRTKDTNYNVVSVGARLAQVLEEGGVQVVHDQIMHDAPSYSNSYSHARAETKENLKKYPGISLVLDVHRDAVENKKGEQVKFTVETQKGTAAQLMLVVGTNARLSHADWPENMAMAVKLHALLEKKYPGICRPISFRSQRFNQDLSPGALIVEVGSAGNSRQEALLAAEILGEVILELSEGAAIASSTS